ncbi:MAG: glycosyltransferase family 2 protein [Bacteroidales bacterium]|nr:glycosyltransferase family 2 protein [Bacteroidales bacterium]
MKKILVIVVVYNGMTWLSRCLGSVEASSVPADLFIVDNGSSDGSVGFIREHFPQARLEVDPSNPGFAASNNVGLRYALENGYDYVYLMNQDAWVLPDTLERLVEVGDRNPGFGILSPVQMKDGCEEMDLQFSQRTYASRTEVSVDLWSVPYVMAAHWLVSRRCLGKVGLFAPLFPFYGEDENYCSRALYHGFRVGVVPTARAVHDRAARTEPKDRKVFRNFYMKSLTLLADPSRKWPLLRFLYIIPYSLHCCFKYRSFLPLKYLGKVFATTGEALTARRGSMSEGAFIRQSVS